MYLPSDNPNADDEATLQDAIRTMLQRFAKGGWKILGLVLQPDELDNAVVAHRVGDTLHSCLFPDPTMIHNLREMPLFDGIRIKMGEGDMSASVFVVQREDTGKMNAHKRLYPFDREIYDSGIQ